MKLTIDYQDIKKIIRNLTISKNEETGKDTFVDIDISKGRNNSVCFGYLLDLGFTSRRIRIDCGLDCTQKNDIILDFSSSDSQMSGLLTAADGIIDFAQNALKLPLSKPGKAKVQVNVPTLVRFILEKNFDNDVKKGLSNYEKGAKKASNEKILSYVDPKFFVFKSIICNEDSIIIELSIS